MKHKTSILTTALLFSTPFALAVSNSPTLNYSYAAIYGGTGGQLTVTNTGNTPVSVSQLSFVSNATFSGNPWGSLYGWQSSVSQQPDADGVDTDTTITESPIVTIAAGQSVALTYNIKSIGGPFAPYNAAMNPTNITVTQTSPTPGTFSLPIVGACSGSACQDPGNGKRIIGYFPDWAYWRTPSFTASQVPYNKLNTIMYAFSIFDSNGNISLYDSAADPANLPIIAQARLQYPYLHASLSFGGWSWASTPSGWTCQKGASPQGPAACFSQMASNPTAMATFVSNAVKAMKEVHFDGIDIDWEYAETAQDTNDYVTLITSLRTALNAQGKTDGVHYYLTVAAPAGIDKINAFTKAQWQTIASNVDSIDVMTYDFHGGFDSTSDFMSAMKLDPTRDPYITNPTVGKYDITDALNEYSQAGVQPSQITLGIPLYGRISTIAGAGSMQGLYQPITGTAAGEWDNAISGITGLVDYQCIVDPSICGNGYTLTNNLTLIEPTSSNLGEYSQTPWGYSPSLFVTYDDITSATTKANFVTQQGYSGVMFWDVTGDFPATDKRSIISTVQAIFNPSAAKK